MSFPSVFIRSRTALALLLAASLPLGGVPVAAQTPPPSASADALPLPAETPIRLGRMPALSPDGTRLCFCWQGSLWVAPSGGGVATRLTSASETLDDNPHWSPDGRWIAFNSDRNGGRQVYLIPAVGGPVRQVTFHSGGASIGDWFPDGRSLVVIATRETLRPAIFKLDAVTGRMTVLVSDAHTPLYPTISHDGKWVAYARGAVVDLLRKGYRGAANYDLWVAPTDGSGPPRRVTRTNGNEWWPQWSADDQSLVFTAEEENGRNATVWRQSVRGGSPKRLVTGNADAVRYLTSSRNGTRVAFECGGQLCVVPSEGGPAKPVAFLCRTDERGPREARVTYKSDHVSEFAVSPDGKRAVIGVRGDLFLINLEKAGEARRLTDNPTRDDGVTWSPDGKRIVYASLRRGETHLYAMDVATRQTVPLTRTPNVSENSAQFSPDGEWIAFRRGPQTGLYIVRPDGTGEQRVVAGPKVGGFRWSPDGRWIAYSQEDDIRTDDVWAVSLTPGRRDTAPLTVGTPLNVTDHPGSNDAPFWSPDGKRLLFISNRYRNRDIETINDSGRFSVYAVPLTRDPDTFDDVLPDETAPTPSDKPPAKPETPPTPDAPPPDKNKPDPEKTAAPPLPSAPAKPDTPKKETPTAKTDTLAPTTTPGKKPAVIVNIDEDEIERRAKQLVALEDSTYEPMLSPDGKVLTFVALVQGRGDLWAANADGSNVRRVTSGGASPDGMEWTTDGTKLYYVGGDGSLHFLTRDALNPGASANPGTIAFTVRLTIDRLTDYQAVFDEAWQTIADRYYDPKYHGVDWKAVGAKYRALLPSCNTRSDFDYLVRQMIGELNSSHTGIGAPDPPRSAPPTGYPGWIPDRKYEGPGVRVAAVVRRSPADREESRIKPGEFVLTVEGQDVQADSTLDKALSDTVGRTVRLTVAPANTAGKPDTAKKRVVQIKPIGSGAWYDLLYERWIDERRAIADKASNKRVAYMHIADMGSDTRNRFERELFSLGRRADAIVVDIRGNNGGDTHDAILRILARNRYYFTMSPRMETPFGQPERAVTKPVVLLTDEYSLSDAEVLSNGFQELKVGTVVGMPTMGWIIFTSGRRLLDGSMFRVPHMGCFTNDGRDMENWGVPPNIHVESTPADEIAGRDPQLERAVAEALKDKR